MTISSLPSSERPRERLLRVGAGSLSLQELLAVILRTGRKGSDVMEIAAEVLREYPDERALSRATFAELRGFAGLGETKAAAILAAAAGVRVVIVSAYNEFEYARTALRAGAADYLLKPVKPADIAALVKKTAEERAPAAAAAGGPPRTPALARAVADYVAKNLDKPVHLQDIARAVFVSPYHLSRTFKQLTGRTIVEYVQEQRLAKAEEILAATDFSITEVAGLVGFNDAAYFATCFKQKTGVTPGQYRKRQKF